MTRWRKKPFFAPPATNHALPFVGFFLALIHYCGGLLGRSVRLLGLPRPGAGQVEVDRVGIHRMGRPPTVFTRRRLYRRSHPGHHEPGVQSCSL
jgi:hypothetical protein